MSQKIQDTILFLLLAALCGTTSFLTLREIIYEESVESTVLSGIKVGETRLVLKSIKTENCFGEFLIKLSDENQIFHASLTGWASLTYNNQTIPVTIKGEVEFNPLGQLGASVVNIDALGNNYRIGSKNINPITVVFGMRPNDSTTDIEKFLDHNIPGPFEMHREGNQTVRLSGPLLLAVAMKPFSKETTYKFPITFSRDTDELCSKASSTPLNLSELKSSVAELQQSLRSFSSHLPAWLPQLMNPY